MSKEFDDEMEELDNEFDRSLTLEDKVDLMMVFHFPVLFQYTKDQKEFDKALSRIKCSDCMDFKSKVCKGRGFRGEECVACMEEHADQGEFGISSNFVH